MPGRKVERDMEDLRVNALLVAIRALCWIWDMSDLGWSRTRGRPGVGAHETCRRGTRRSREYCHP